MTSKTESDVPIQNKAHQRASPLVVGLVSGLIGLLGATLGGIAGVSLATLISLPESVLVYGLGFPSGIGSVWLYLKRGGSRD